MEPLREHTLAFTGLKDGQHEFDFVLGSAFFAATGVEDFIDGEGTVHVVLDKNDHLLVANLHVDARITMLCDHCNNPMQQHVEGDQRQIFKPSDGPGGDDDELVGLDPSAHEINLTHYIFECISLHLPARHVHPPGQCDPEVEGALAKVQVHGEAAPDPRWSALDQLKKKNA